MAARSPPGPTSPLNDRNPSWSTQSRNPVALRLYKVLGTNFNDEATKEALKTLSDLYASNASVSKGKEVKRDVDDLDDDELEDEHRSRDAPEDTFVEVTPGEAAANARKHLRRDMEEKLAEGSRQFLRAFGEVDQKLDELQEHVRIMRASCDEAEAQLKVTSESSQSLLERASNLRKARQDVETKKSILSLFLKRFTLNDEEVEAMTSRDIPVGKRFFEAMDKTERIRADCQVLMSGEDGPTKAGLDIMAFTAAYLEQGYEKILRWSSYELRQAGRDSQLEVTPIMREAIRRIRKRPELLNEALSSLSQTRQTALLNSFLAALTRGGPSGLPRPIELHAHDPMRYVGDMLAWVHQAVAAEREFLEGLFGMESDRMMGSVHVKGDSEEAEWVRELMDLSLGKLCVPLKVRIQQTVRSQESSITSYKIANLLQFYMLTMRRTIGAEAVLSITLQEMTDVAYKVFHEAIEAQGRALLRVPLDLDDTSVSPPLLILDHSQIMREIMLVYQSSLLGDEVEEVADTDVMSGKSFQKILDVMVDPALEMCVAAGDEKKRVRVKWDKEVFILNCVTYVLNVLDPFEFTKAKQGKVQVLVDEHVELLTNEHYEEILVDAGLSSVVHACLSHDRSSEPLSRNPATSPQALQTALHQFSSWISTAAVTQSPRLSLLSSQRLNTRIHQASLERVAGAYKRVCDEVRNPVNRYEAGSTLLGSERPFGRADLVRSIFGLGEV